MIMEWVTFIIDSIPAGEAHSQLFTVMYINKKTGRSLGTKRIQAGIDPETL